MDLETNNFPESLNYLPAAFRAEIVPAGISEHHFARWLLQTFESNVHLAERAAQHSGMLFGPDEVAVFWRWLASPRLSSSDLVEVPAFVLKLSDPPEGDNVSTHLRHLLRKLGSVERKLRPETLVEDLNRLIQGPCIYDEQIFKQVKLLPVTKALLAVPRRKDASLLNRFVLQDAYPAHVVTLPAASLFKRDDWEWKHLEWLASLLDLKLDQDWRTQSTKAGQPGDGNASFASGPVHRGARVRPIIKNIARIYPRHGTPGGISEMIKLLYGIDLEIVERSWPQGMEVGLSSVIGVDTFLMDRFKPDRHFVALVKSNAHNRLLPLSGQWIESRLTGQFEHVRIKSLLSTNNAEAGSPGHKNFELPQEQLPVMITKLRSVIDRERPAHTQYYLGIESVASTLAPRVKSHPLVIGEHSTISGFFIN